MIAGLCRRLDGLPLALELAAARTRVLSPAAILRRLDQRAPGTLAHKATSDRQASLESVLDWSIALLPESHRSVLLAVALPPGGFDLRLAESLIPDVDVLGSLDVLVAHGLARPNGEPRYRLLETVRVAALQRLAPEATAGLWRRLAISIRELVAEGWAAMRRGDQGAIGRIELDQDNLRAALDWAETADLPLAIAIAADAGDYWLHTRPREGSARLHGLLERPLPYSAEVGRAMVDLLVIDAELHGELAVQPLAESFRRLASNAGDQGTELGALILLVAHRPELVARIQELADQAADPTARIDAYLGLTQMSIARLDWAACIDHLEDGLTVAQDAGLSTLSLIGNLALIHLYADDGARALDYAGLAVDGYRRSGSASRLSWVLGLLAMAAETTGRPDQATDAAREALSTAVTSGGESQVSEALWASVPVLTRLGGPLMAAEAWGAADAAMGSSGMLDADRMLAERLLAPARRLAGNVAFEVAVAAGRKRRIADIVSEVNAILDNAPAPPSTARLRLAHGELTRREVEILQLVGDGKSDAEIGALLFISPKTASVHVSNVKAKLGVESRLDAALQARELGLVDARSDAILGVGDSDNMT